jgi:kinesin family protein 3/17
VSGRRPVRQSFDRAFDERAKQSEVYNFLRPLVASSLDGYNSTVFAFGQTGTGKTFTMLGDDGGAEGEAFAFDGPRDRWGVIPRAVRDIFTFVTASSGTTQCKVWISYLEVYNEKIFDLLHAGDGGGELDIREDKQRGVFVAGASEVLATSRDDVFAMLRRGGRARAVGETDMNARSSRSHTIFRATIEQVVTEVDASSSAGASDGGGDGDAARPASPQPKLITRSKLNLVDLAGSEKWQTHQMSRMSGKQVSEMTAINRSLSALGNCIRALSESGRSHIPFRDSKLTRLLADSLGGNTRTAFIVTLSPALEAADESRMSLQFASRAKRVAVHASVNKTVDDASQLLRLERKIASLRNELRQASRGVRPNQPLGRGDRGGGRGGGRPLVESIVQKTTELESRNAALLQSIHRCDGAAAQEAEESSRLRRAVSEAKRTRGENDRDAGARVQYALLQVQSAAVAANLQLASARGALFEDKENALERHIEVIMSSDLGDGRGGGGAEGRDARRSLPLKGRLMLAEMSLLAQALELEQLKSNHVAQIERLRASVEETQREVDFEDASMREARAGLLMSASVASPAASPRAASPVFIAEEEEEEEEEVFVLLPTGRVVASS